MFIFGSSFPNCDEFSFYYSRGVFVFGDLNCLCLFFMEFRLFLMGFLRVFERYLLIPDGSWLVARAVCCR